MVIKTNPVQFAVVREDAQVESNLVAQHQVSRALLIASGGCTALSLQAYYPSLRMTLVDQNPAQLALVKDKINALRSLQGEARMRAFNMGRAAHCGLNAAGNFETLFRSLSQFIDEFVISIDDLYKALAVPTQKRKTLDKVFAHKYWPVAFQLFFSEPLLHAMFTPAATQHAVKGSYPGYFQRVFERGLSRQDAASNYFLHHLLRGCYEDPLLGDAESVPPYLALETPDDYHFDWVLGGIDAVKSFEGYGLVSLSNIFDWMPQSEVAQVAARLGQEMPPQSVLVYRQLNHNSDFHHLFAGDFKIMTEQSTEALAADRSLFYSRITIACKK